MSAIDCEETCGYLDEARDAVIEAMSWADPESESGEGASAAMRALVAIRMAKIGVELDLLREPAPESDDESNDIREMASALATKSKGASS